MTVYVGQDIRVTLTALDPDGATANPAGVRFKVKAPGGTTTTYTLGVDSQVTEVTSGRVYALTIDVPTNGRYLIRGETLNGSSAVVAVDEMVVIVAKSRVV